MQITWLFHIDVDLGVDSDDMAASAKWGLLSKGLRLLEKA